MDIVASKVLLCWPNRVDEGVLAGGSWSADFPLANLQLPQFAARARTDGTTAAWTLTLPAAREVQSLAISAHNLTATATWRARLYSDEAGTNLLLDTDVTAPAYAINTHTRSADDRAIYPPLAVMLLAQAYSVRHIKIDVADASNADGYLQFGRFFVASAWQPSVNFSWGSATGLQIGTTRQTALDAVTDWFDRKGARRTAAFTLAHLDDDEAYLELERMQRTLDIDGELLFARRLDKPNTRHVTTFIATLTTPSPIEHPNLPYWSGAVGLLEKRA
jgi:hypothetical protein